MGLDDIPLREEIDLAERAREIREELIPDLEERIAAAEAALEDDDADDPEDSPNGLQGLKKTLEGQAKACDRVVDALDGDGVFVLQELMTAETGLLTDDVSERSIEIDYERERMSGAPKQGYHKSRTLELSIIDAPAEMESNLDREIGRDVYAVGKLPDLVSDYLYDIATALNDSGEVEGVGNLSHYGVTIADD